MLLWRHLEPVKIVKTQTSRLFLNSKDQRVEIQVEAISNGAVVSRFLYLHSIRDRNENREKGAERSRTGGVESVREKKERRDKALHC